MTTRRNFMKGTVATAATVVVLPMPSYAIAGLTPITTLSQLAAEGKYASTDHELPQDVATADFKFFLNGKLFEPIGDEIGFIKEIYAPGGPSGWAVVYVNRYKDEVVYHGVETKLVRGDWRMEITRD